jgi:BirA family biotin operon repressor/biotin-[acetyl-CoA-carboxylase] ligase
MFDLAALESDLAHTIFAGNLHFAAVTGSTNSDAMAAARNGAPHGSVWLADEQLAGRGRGGHAWHSAAGQGLYVSVLLRPQLPAASLPLLPLVAGLAAAHAIRAVSSLAVDLRWPNDLLIGPRKAGGILIEARNDSEGLPHAVVLGIGINVHQRSFDAGLPPQRRGPVAGAPGFATPATSLDLAAGRTISRQTLLIALLKSLQRETNALLDPGEAAKVPTRVGQASTWVRGRNVEVHGPQACVGVTDGLDEQGFLRVQTAAGLVIVQTGGIRAPEIN